MPRSRRKRQGRKARDHATAPDLDWSLPPTDDLAYIETESARTPLSGSDTEPQPVGTFARTATNDRVDLEVRDALLRRWKAKKANSLCVETAGGIQLYCEKSVLAIASDTLARRVVEPWHEGDRLRLPVSAYGLVIVLETIDGVQKGVQPTLYTSEPDFTNAIDLCSVYQVQALFRDLVVYQALRYLSSINPFIAYARAVHEFRLDDAWKAMILSIQMPGADFPWWTRWFLLEKYCPYFDGYMRCKQVLLWRLERFRAYFREGIWQVGCLRVINVLCGMRVGIDHICPVYRRYDGRFSRACKAVARQFVRVYKTGDYPRLEDLKRETLAILDCPKCRRTFDRRINEALDHFPEPDPLFGPQQLLFAR